MEAKFAGFVLIATLLCTSTAVKAVVPRVATNATRETIVAAATPNLTTTFSCVRQGNSFATIAHRGDRSTPPVITWTTPLGDFTPHARCQIVSEKLTQVVAENGGKLMNLQLMTGAVRHQVVVCAVKGEQASCNSNNMLFTLRPENARRADQVLARLNQFPVSGFGTTVVESAGTNTLPLEALDQFLGPEN